MRKTRLFGCVLAGMAVLESAVLPVKAGEVNDDALTGYVYRLREEPKADYLNMTHHLYNGRPAYCVEPWAHVGDGDVYNQSSVETWPGFSPDVRESILLAAVFGEGYPGREGNLWYIAAQDIIWEETNEPVEWGAKEQKVRAAVAEIRKSMEAYRTAPDFQIRDTVENREVGESGANAVLKDGVAGRMYQVTDQSGMIASLHNGKAEGLRVFDENQKEIQASEISSDTFYLSSDGSGKEGKLIFTGISGKNRYEDIPIILYGNEKDPEAQKHIVTGSIPQRSYEIRINASEVPFLVQKTDEKGKSLKGASLTVEKDGEIIDSWISDGDTHQLRLKPGETYQIRETDAPDGYYCRDSVFTVSEDHHSDEIMNVVNEDRIRYEVMKSDENGKPVEGARLALYDVTDGSAKLVKMDDRQGNPWVTDGKPRDLSSYLHVNHTYSIVEEDVSTRYFLAEDAVFTVSQYAPEGNPMIRENMTDHQILYRFAKIDENGNPVADAQLTIYDLDQDGREVCHFTTGTQPTTVGILERGHHYRLVETMTPDGRFTMEEKEFTVPQYHQDGPITITGIDYSIVYYADKVNEKNEPVAGATMEIHDVTDGSDRLVESFVTTQNPHRITGLSAGHHYVLHEVSAPEGYYQADDVLFTVPEKGNQEPVHVRATDHSIHLPVRKTDTDGHPLADITLEVIEKETGMSIGSWQTKPDTDIEIGHLVQAGKEYILKETESVNGYYLHADIEFSVPEKYVEGNDITVTMQDAPIRIEVLKEDETGKPLEGAHITLREKDTDQVIHEWDSVTEPHDISSYVYPGRTYVLKETEIVAGHYEAVEQEFTVASYPKEDNPTVTLKMIDETVHYEIVKIDESGKPVRGVHLKVTDRETGEVKDEWDTDENAHDLTGILDAGKTYILEETEWVNGVLQAQNMQFTVPKQGTSAAIRIEMLDETLDLAFLKTDENGKPLAGALLTILDDQKNEICSFTSTDDPHGVSRTEDGTAISSLLKGGSTYVLHEKKAPVGYETAEDITFTATGTLAVPQVISMTDRKGMIWIHLIKKDAGNPDQKLEGAELTVFRHKDDAIAKDPEGNDVVLYTDENGDAWTEILYDPQGYYVKETKAPEGYQITDLIYEVKPSEKIGFSEDHPVVIEVLNDREVKTGTGMDYRLLSAAGFLILSVFLLLRRQRKKG